MTKTPLTKEERSARIKQQHEERRREKEKAERRFPSARLSEYKNPNDYLRWVQIVLDSESLAHCLEIRLRGDVLEVEEGDVRYARIDLSNHPRQLARLIRGLIARYNDLIRELNEEVEATPALQSAKIFAATEEPECAMNLLPNAPSATSNTCAPCSTSTSSSPSACRSPTP